MFKWKQKSTVTTPDLLQSQVDAALSAFTVTMSTLEEVSNKADREEKAALEEAEKLTEKAKQCSAIKERNQQTINKLKGIFGEGAQ